MARRPKSPKIYHITHVDNLAPIASNGWLLCDREIFLSGRTVQTIGMSNIKRRRIEEREVKCHPGTKVGDYVPFNFCPRSVMLFVISRRNHPELTYLGGQGPIVHLEADLERVVQWADENRRKWAFSLSNAGAKYTEFRHRINDLALLDWDAIAAPLFVDARIKERKQAEFLLHERFPFELVERIGVHSIVIETQAAEALADTPHRPLVEIRPEWYF